MQAAAAEHPEAGRTELWFADEARVCQKGRVTHTWYARGSRPRGLCEHRFASAHLFGAVCPERDTGIALVLPEVSTAAMGLFLAELAEAVRARRDPGRARARPGGMAREPEPGRAAQADPGPPPALQHGRERAR